MRTPQATVDPLFVNRWSPRAFSSRPLEREQVQALFEAARWAPSSFNEQPWLFVYGTREEDRARIAGLLSESNRSWAQHAPLLAVLFCRTTHAKTGEANRTAGFDTGSAWMSLALQAQLLGLSAHAMAGFDRDRACAALGVPEGQFEPLAAIAVGYRGDAGQLPPKLAAREVMSDRKPLKEIAVEGTYGER